jgi:hypothetical protein
MNWTKANQLLSGIDRLFNIFQESDGLSTIERDLLLRRIQDLYEVVLEGDFEAGQRKGSKVVKDIEPPVVRTIEPPKVVERPKPVVIEQAPVIEKPKPIIEEPKPPVIQQPKVVVDTPKPVVEPPKPPVVEKPKEIVYQPINHDSDEDLELLFEFKSATDLSEKLSAAPILDLKTAMGINERFLIISELFKGNKAQYDDAVETLNSFSDFEQAKNYISRILVPEFDWTNEKKINQAKIFIKKVRRRYL